jgi:LysM repeat protein
MKRLIALLTAAIFYSPLLAQQPDLQLQGVAPKHYLTHTVAAKENWYSVGRVYNISPKDIAPFNQLTMEKGLNPGQTLKIPLQAINFTADKKAGFGEVLVPVYHTVAEKEGLYRVATNAGIKVEQLKALNGLSGDALSVGSKLIVGYLKVKQADSPLAGAAPEVKNEPVKDVVKTTPPPVQKKEEVKIAEPPPPVREYAKMPTPEEEKRDAEMMAAQQKKAPVAPVKETKPAGGDLGEGYFKTDFLRLGSYGKESKTTTVQSGVFKTMSGWQDAKYYALMDGVAPGSIVQVTCKNTNKIIYAKVLGEMQELKQNNGLGIRISNAAANALDMGNDQFEVIVKY